MDGITKCPRCLGLYYIVRGHTGCSITPRLYRLDEKCVDDAIDLLFTYVDNLLSQKKFSECDSFLLGVDADLLSVTLLVAIMSITFSAKDQLKERPLFIAKVEQHLQKVTPNRSSSLMEGLR
jgi:hypothetical protein